MAKKQTGANIGFEEKLWLGADKLRGSMDASEYKHIILGLIFLKYISDKFSERRDWLIQETGDSKSEYHTKNDKDQMTVLEDRDEYTAKSIFWVEPDIFRKGSALLLITPNLLSCKRFLILFVSLYEIILPEAFGPIPGILINSSFVAEFISIGLSK